MVAVWPAIHAERQALLADLRDVPDEQWQTRSLCSQWTVKQVFGHMIATAQMTPPKFFLGLAGSGFSFTGFIEKNADRFSTGSPADLLAAFGGMQHRTNHPPGPNDTWLGEAIVHAEDIRRPLGIHRDYPLEAVTQVADSYKGSNLVIGAKNRIAGVTLRATDTDWTHGTGPEAAGRAIDLLLAMTGRPAGLDQLTGDGADILRSRA
jgi:uncharacterized protein (TIGR03083 family)